MWKPNTSFICDVNTCIAAPAVNPLINVSDKREQITPNRHRYIRICEIKSEKKINIQSPWFHEFSGNWETNRIIIIISALERCQQWTKRQLLLQWVNMTRQMCCYYLSNSWGIAPMYLNFLGLLFQSSGIRRQKNLEFKQPVYKRSRTFLDEELYGAKSREIILYIYPLIRDAKFPKMRILGQEKTPYIYQQLVVHLLEAVSYTHLTLPTIYSV